MGRLARAAAGGTREAPYAFGAKLADWHVGATTLVARADIAAGEELTIDYATHTGVETWSMSCRCGSDRCRGTVSGAVWRLARLQRAYGDHWSPILLNHMVPK